MRRRKFLRNGIVVGSTCVAGCMGDSGGTTGESQGSEQPQAYRFYFDDQADTLGGAADQEIPEDAINQQVSTNTTTEDEWQEMQLNDVEFTKIALNTRGMYNISEGSVEGIEQQTIQLYQERKDSSEFQDQHDAEIFTESVLDAVLEVTDASTGPAQSSVVKTVADHIAHTNEQVDLQNYKLSEGRSMIGDAGGNRLSHPIGLLQYEEDGETQVRYAEIENRFNNSHSIPEKSVYATPIGAETQWSDSDPSDWVSVFDYQKFRRLYENGDIDKDRSLGRQLTISLMNVVDDVSSVGYDLTESETETGRDNELADEPIDAVVSDSFGTSVEDYVKNPEEGEYIRKEFETTARTIFTALETENFGGEFALDGDLSNPVVYKTEKDALEKIRADMAYDEVGSRVVS